MTEVPKAENSMLSTTEFGDMSMQRYAGFDQHDDSMETKKMPNSFVVDIENLSSHTTNANLSANSSISGMVKLQRKLSRKGSQREDRNKTTLSASTENTDRSSSTGATPMVGCSTPVPLASFGEKESINKQPQPRITLSAEKECNSRKPVKHGTSFVNPRRVLFFFATLSSMGTLILIYFTLSISRFSAGTNTRAQQ